MDRADLDCYWAEDMLHEIEGNIVRTASLLVQLTTPFLEEELASIALHEVCEQICCHSKKALMHDGKLTPEGAQVFYLFRFVKYSFAWAHTSTDLPKLLIEFCFMNIEIVNGRRFLAFSLPHDSMKYDNDTEYIGFIAVAYRHAHNLTAFFRNCNACGKQLPKFVCAKCRVVRYCGSKHQKGHWNIHKDICWKLASYLSNG